MKDREVSGRILMDQEVYDVSSILNKKSSKEERRSIRELAGSIWKY